MESINLEDSCYIRIDNKDFNPEDEKKKIDYDKDRSKIILLLKVKEYDEEFLKRVYNFAISIKEEYKEKSVEVQVDAVDLEFKVSDVERLFIPMGEKCEEANINFSFSEVLAKYSIEETLRAQKKINSIVDSINATGASPLEKYLMAYNYVTTKIYKENEKERFKARDLIAVLNGDDIVCVGYAQLMDRICRGIGIKSYSQSCYGGKEDIDPNNKYVSESDTNHRNNLVYMKDEKYGIDGWFYSDACLDSRREKESRIQLLNWCLIPLSDKDKINGGIIKVAEDQKIDGLPIGSIYGDIDVSKYYWWYDIKSGLSEEDADKIESSVNKRFLDDERRKKACETLAKILRKAKVQKDMYDKLDTITYLNIPKEHRYEYLLALLMKDNPNIEKITECVEKTKEFFKKKSLETAMNKKSLETTMNKKFAGKIKKIVDKMFFKNRNSKIKLKTPNGIYRKLKELEKAPSRTEILVKMKNGEYVDLFDKMPIEEFEVQKKLGEDLYSGLGKQVPKEWKKSIDCYKTGLACKTIKEKVKRGTAIPLETFQKALTNNFMLKGKNEEISVNVANNVIKYNVYCSEEVYNNDAENCFKKAALEKQLEREL